MNELQDAGIIYIAYRRLGKFNSCGKPVYLFTKHPYFEKWTSLLSVNVQVNSLIDDQVENAKKVDTVGFEKDKQVSTYSLSDNQQEKEFKETYVNDADFISENIPKPFTNLVNVFFPINQVYDYWKMVNIAYYKNNCETAERKLDIAISAFKQMIGKLRHKDVKKPISYYYGILMRKYNDLFHEELDALFI